MSFRVAGAMTVDNLPRYQLGAELLEGNRDVNAVREEQLKTMAEGAERRKLEKEFDTTKALIDLLRRHFGTRKDRVKDQFVTEMESLVDIEFEAPDDQQH